MEIEKFKKAKLKIASFCAYQERCQQEVISKLYTYGLFRDQVDEILAWLITENFVNEERFAKTFVGGKFRIKKWGKHKITQALKKKDISEYCINQGLKEIENEVYLDTINQLIIKKFNDLYNKFPDPYQRKDRTARYLISKGFEPNLVWESIKNLDLD
jgi:regulatory protein